MSKRRKADFELSVEVRGRMAWLRLTGALRAAASAQLCRVRVSNRLGLAIADLRKVEVADSLGALALRAALDRLPRAARLLPPGWSPARAPLERALASIPCYERPGDLAAREKIPLPSPK